MSRYGDGSVAPVVLACAGLLVVFTRPPKAGDPVAVYACVAVFIIAMERWLFPKIDRWMERRAAQRERTKIDG